MTFPDYSFQSIRKEYVRRSNLLKINFKIHSNENIISFQIQSVGNRRNFDVFAEGTFTFVFTLLKKEIMLILQNISYIHSDGELLFDHIDLSVAPKEKIAIIANNGAGKSTLLKIIAGQLLPHTGTVTISSNLCYMPQIVGQFDRLSVAQALGIADRLNALSEILSGNVTDENLTILNDDWTVEERCREALSCWELDGLDLNARMETLSGGQKTKVFLAGIQILHPEIVLLDEPTNHLDSTGRNLLYRFVGETSATVVTVSHDRALLNRLEKMCELNRHGMKVYGGNYDFYKAQKMLEQEALADDLEERQKALRKADCRLFWQADEKTRPKTTLHI
jgi:ATPase subunit of ABC transporter with duplicated ATPase domains